MRLSVYTLLFALAASAVAAPKAPVTPSMMALVSQRLDNKLGTMLPADDPVQPVGLTQGTYLDGFGVVFMGSLNLAPMAGISPFHQTISKEEYARVRQKKLARLPKLKALMQDMLLNMAATMDTVPPDDQIAIAIALFSFAGEDTTGIPSQIVMRAQKKSLLAAMEGKADRSTLASSIHSEEF